MAAMVMSTLPVATVACDDSGGDETSFELVGEWTGPFGSETISATSWNAYDTSGELSFEQRVTSFDNAANSAIVQNLPTAEFGPNTYGRIVWTEPAATGFAYCTVAFGHATPAEAQAAPEQGVDRNDLAAGCAGFGWSTLTRWWSPPASARWTSLS
jgi:hypothetical protein